MRERIGNLEKRNVDGEKRGLGNYAALLFWQARRQPQREALVIDDESLTYEMLWQRVASMALAASSLGVHGDVLVEADDFLEQAIAFLALQAVGVRPILLHHGMRPEDLQAILQENHLQGIWRCRSGGVQLFDASGLPEQPHEEADILGVLSSGSTGTPKVMYRTYESWAGFFPVQDEIFSIDGETVLFLQGSLSFTGNTNSWLSVLYEGGTVVTSRLMRCHVWEELLRRHAVDVLYLVPTKLQLLGRAMTAPYDGLRMLFTGSQLLTPAMLRRLQQLFPAGAILLYYGASELNYITYAICEDPDRDSSNLGRPFPGIRVSVGDDGLIYVDTPYHVSGARIPFTVKDTGHLNEKGELIFGGRRAAWINKGGVKLSTVRLELLLKVLPGVADAVVLPVKDRLRGDAAAAFLVAEKGEGEQAIRRTVRQSLKPVEVPDSLIFLPQIPLNDRGKVDRNALRRLLASAGA